MAWAAFNILLSGAKPIWLYKLTFGGQEFFHTSSGKIIHTPINSPVSGFPANVWEPLAIKLGNVKRSNKTSKNNATITIPRNCAVADKILQERWNTGMKVEVWQGFYGDSDNEYITVFNGSPNQIKPSWAKVQLVCTDTTAVLENKGISRVIQTPCPYELFGRGCGLDETTFLTVGTATAWDDFLVTVTEAATQPDGYFNNGQMLYNGERQTIRRHVGDQLLIAGGHTALKNALANTNQNVTLLPGCRKSFDYCNTFSNTINYGGFRQLLKSPYDGDGIL